MFARISTTIVSFVSLAVLAAAVPNYGSGGPTCSTGPIQCCDTMAHVRIRSATASIPPASGATADLLFDP